MKEEIPSEEESYEFGRWRVEPSERLVLRDGEAVALTGRVFDTLLYFVRNPGRLLKKDELMSAIWPDVTVDENNLSQNVSTLRRIFGREPPESGFIATVPGRGYRFTAPVIVSMAERARRAVPSTVTSQPAAPRQGRRPLVAAAILVAAVAAALAVAWGVYVTRFRTAGRPIRSIAVLPFKPLVASAPDQVLEFGMTDTLIARLSTLDNLTVRPMSAVRRFGAPDQDARAAGRELGVEAVVDGTIQRSGRRVRVAARLVRVRDDRQLWAERFDTDMNDIFAVQDEIAERVARELIPRLSADARERLTRHSTSNPQAYELYLRGRFYASIAQPQQAVRVYEQAIARDPRFALAHAGLADISSRLPVAADVRPQEVIPRASAAARRALELDPDVAEAHTALGWIEFYYGWDWAASEASFRRALAIHPRDLSANLGRAHLLSNLGRHDEALTAVEAALRADPLSPLAQSLKAQFLFHAGRHAEAAREVERTVERDPAFWIATLLRGRIHEDAGRHDAALASYEQAQRATRSMAPLAFAAHALAAAGRRADATQVLAELQERSRRSYVPPYYFAVIFAGLGDDAQTLHWLEEGYRVRDARMVFLAVDPYWQRFRSNPNFQALIRRMNLPPFSDLRR